MIRLLSALDFHRFSPRLYLVAKTDETSLNRLQNLESQKNSLTDSVSIELKYISFLFNYLQCFIIFDSLNIYLVSNRSHIKK